MHSISLALDALDAAVAGVVDLDFGGDDPVARLRALERLETARRRLAVPGHDVIAGLAHADPAEVGGPVHQAIADWLRISCADVRRRLRDAQQLTPRVTITGEVLPPELPATAEVWREGLLDPQHLKVIQTFVRDLPSDIPVATVEQAERFLAEQATALRPDQLEKVAHRCAAQVNPDGKFSDVDRARQRGFTWSPQRSDGMSIGKLVASPELRANLDAWMARFAAPGAETISATDEPDLRTHAQRQHDALNALVRGQLGDPKLGAHNGLPVTVVVTTTLRELTAGAAKPSPRAERCCRCVISSGWPAAHTITSRSSTITKSGRFTWAGPGE